MTTKEKDDGSKAEVTRVKTQAAEPILSSDTLSSATDRPQNTPNSATQEKLSTGKNPSKKKNPSLILTTPEAAALKKEES